MTIFTGKYLRWNPFLIKLKAFKLATLLKRDSERGVFLQIFKNIYLEEHLRTTASERVLSFVQPQNIWAPSMADRAKLVLIIDCWKNWNTFAFLVSTLATVNDSGFVLAICIYVYIGLICLFGETRNCFTPSNSCNNLT